MNGAVFVLATCAIFGLVLAGWIGVRLARTLWIVLVGVDLVCSVWNGDWLGVIFDVLVIAAMCCLNTGGWWGNGGGDDDPEDPEPDPDPEDHGLPVEPTREPVGAGR